MAAAATRNLWVRVTVAELGVVLPTKFMRQGNAGAATATAVIVATPTDDV